MKILVPVDGSDNSRRALEQAVSMAKTLNASITIVHVIDVPPTVYVESQKLLDQLLAKFREESAKILDEYTELALKQSVKADTKVMEGDAAASIVSYSQKGGFDMIVMGSRGLGGFKGLLLGSVSNAVIQTSKVPVMIIK